MPKVTRTGIGSLSRRYTSVLRKCLLINLGVLGLGSVFTSTNAIAQDVGVTALTSTLDKLNKESIAYLNSDHAMYDLSTSSGTDKGSIIINGITYYYKPNQGDTAVVNLAGIGGAALVESTEEPANYVFRLKTGGAYTYYSYDTSKLALSGIKINQVAATSVAYVNGEHNSYDLVSTQGDHTNSIKINN